MHHYADSQSQADHKYSVSVCCYDSSGGGNLTFRGPAFCFAYVIK